MFLPIFSLSCMGNQEYPDIGASPYQQLFHNPECYIDEINKGGLIYENSSG